MGLISSSAKSITKCLSEGMSVGLVVGGGREAMIMTPGFTDIVLQKRKGFVKLAMKTGASLVPVLTFGETALYQSATGRALWTPLNRLLLGTLGMSLPILSGTNGTFLPRKCALQTVVGTPMKVETISEPTPEQIETVHSDYCKHLESLYDRHKDAY